MALKIGERPWLYWPNASGDEDNPICKRGSSGGSQAPEKNGRCVYFSAASRASDIAGRPVDLVDLDDDMPLVLYLPNSGELSVSADLATKLQVALEELRTIREQMSPLIAKLSRGFRQDGGLRLLFATYRR